MAALGPYDGELLLVPYDGYDGEYEQCYWCEYWTKAVNAYNIYLEDWVDPPRPLCDWCFNWHMGWDYYANDPDVLAAGGAVKDGGSWRGGPYEPSALTRAEALIAYWFDDIFADPIPFFIAVFLVPWHAP